MNKVKLAFIATVSLLFFACGSKTDVDFSIVPVKGPNGEYQYIDVSQKGKIVINPQFGEAYIFRDGLALVKTPGKEGKYGYIDKKGKYLIAPTYDYAQDFGEEVAWVQMENQPPMLINKKGKMLLQVDSLTKAYPFANDMATAFYYSQGQILGMFIDKKGKSAVTPVEGNFRTIISDGLYAFQSKGQEKWGYKNAKGETVINEQFDAAAAFFEGVAVVMVGNKYGSINKKGDFIVNPQYDALMYDSDGLFFVRVGKKSGWINTKGEIVINPQFDDLNPFFGNKLAPVQMGKKWGYVDRKGQIAINPQFDGALPFFGDYAPVTNNKKIGFINQKGDFIVAPMYDLGKDDSNEYTYSVGQKKFGLPIWYYFELSSDEDFQLYDRLKEKVNAYKEMEREMAKKKAEEEMAAAEAQMKELIASIESDPSPATAELENAANKWQKEFKAEKAGNFFTFKADGGEEGIYTWKATSKMKIGDCPAKSVIVMGYEGCERWNDVPAKCKSIVPKVITSYKGDSGC
jgi:hypothetical protein